MFSLLKKEVGSFFSTITGYIVIMVFVTANGLFLWILPSDSNVLDSGYANIDGLFALAPWIFLFLVPAVTMRLFADEKKAGTFELLLTRPLTDLQIILAKYFAGVILVLFALLPTLLYYLSVYLLGNPQGNIDTGGTWGSYIGLFFLAAIYVAIGLFSSSLTDNQIVAFIIGLCLCFLFYIGFDSLARIPVLSYFDNLIINFGIASHYKSMSRGVIDSRDIFYFISVVAIFTFSTKLVLESRKW